MKTLKERFFLYGQTLIASMAVVVALSIAALFIGVAVRVIWEGFRLGFNIF